MKRWRIGREWRVPAARFNNDGTDNGDGTVTPPAETFRWLTEAGDVITTEAGDPIRTE